VLVCLCLRRGGHKLVAEFSRFPFHVLDLLRFILLLVFVHAQRVILHFVLEHLVHRPRNRVGGCHRRLGWPQPGTKPPIQCPERAIGSLHCLRCHSERLSRAIPDLQRVIAQHFAPGDVMFGGQSQPPAEMLFGGELLSHIASHFHRHRLCQRDPKPVHQADVHPIQPIQVFSL